MGLPCRAMADGPPPKDRTIGVRATAEQEARWEAGAAARRLTLSDFARQATDAACRADSQPTQAAAPDDPRLAAAAEALIDHYGFADYAALARMAVWAAYRRFKAGVTPWPPEPTGGAPTAATPTRPAGTPRK